MQRPIAALAVMLALATPSLSGAASTITGDREALATWTWFEGVRVVLEVDQAETTTISTGEQLGVARAAQGRAHLALELCETDAEPCTRGQTWAGELGSRATSGLAFTMDPALVSASLEGWVRDVETGRPCRLRVDWLAGDPTGIPHADLDPEAGTAGVIMARAATARLSTTCLHTGDNPAFSAGDGLLSARSNASL